MQVGYVQVSGAEVFPNKPLTRPICTVQIESAVRPSRQAGGPACRGSGQPPASTRMSSARVAIAARLPSSSGSRGDSPKPRAVGRRPGNFQHTNEDDMTIDQLTGTDLPPRPRKEIL